MIISCQLPGQFLTYELKIFYFSFFLFPCPYFSLNFAFRPRILFLKIKYCCIIYFIRSMSVLVELPGF